MKKKNYVGKAVMLGALLAPIGLPTVSVLAVAFIKIKQVLMLQILQTGLPAHRNKLQII